MFLFLSLLTFVVAASAQGEENYRLVGQKAQCIGSSPSCRSDLETLQYTCGTHVRDLKASLKVVYRPDGNVDFTASATNAGSNVAISNKICLGNSTSSNCKGVGTGSTTLSSVNFNVCDFKQEFESRLVHRWIDIQVRHRWQVAAGSPVDFFCYRDIRVHFYLEPEDPSGNVIINPSRNTSLEVCVALTHKIEACCAENSNEWRFTVEPDNYDPVAIGYGFKLQSCYLTPYLKANGLLSVPHRRQIVDNGKLFISAVLPGRTLVNNYVAGRRYDLNIAQSYHRDPAIDKSRPPEISCSVCLCKLGVSQSSDGCPSNVNLIKNGRHAFEEDWVLAENGLNTDLEVGPVQVVPEPKK